VGAIGLGFHSRLNLSALAHMDDVQIVAVCDCFADRRAQGKELVDRLQGNKGCATYEDFRELIAREDIDGGDDYYPESLEGDSRHRVSEGRQGCVLRETHDTLHSRRA